MASINLDRSSRLDIRCRKGDTFKLIFTFDEDQSTDLPVAGWKMQVRTSADDEAGNGQLQVSGSSSFVYTNNGTTLTLTIPAGDMNFSGQYVYDIQNTNSGTVETFFHGVFTVVEDITN